MPASQALWFSNALYCSSACSGPNISKYPLVTILAVGLGFFSVLSNSGIWKINSLANFPSNIFSVWKNCLLKPPSDKGKEAVLYVGSLSITLTFLPSLDRK